MNELRFRLLGPLEAERDGARVELGPRKQRAVLSLLLLEANRVVSTERLIDELWGDSPPETARSALQVYVAGLRKALGADGASLRTSAPGYVLELEPGALDLEEFAALRLEAREATDPERAATALHEALALWRGSPLQELDGEPFGGAAAGQLEEQRLGALEERLEADLALGRHAGLVPELDALVAEHPYRERFRAQQLLALYRSGRQADALAAYRAARTAFVEGLGIEPGAELKALERAMLDQDPALAAPKAAVRPAPAAPVGRRSTWRPATVAVLVVAIVIVAAVFALRDDPAPIAVPPNSVAVIDPATNEVAAAVPVGIRPGPLAVGGGAVWVGVVEDKSLTRIDPASRTVVKTISLAATPTGVSFGSRSVWVSHGLTGQLSRVDPQFGGIKPFDVARTSFRSVSGAVSSGVTAVWAVYGDATFARLDPRSERVETSFAGSKPTAVVEDGGAVWVVSSGDSTVYRFNPPTFRVGPIGRSSVGRSPTAIAYGYGSVWVTSRGDDVVTRIHPSTNSTRQIPVGDEPAAVAVGAEAVWVANGGDGTVSRIDPATNDVVATIDVGHALSGVVVANGLVWTTVQAP